jgi:hypothetical protein
VATNVPGRKTMVTAAIVFIAVLSRLLEMARLRESFAIRMLIFWSRCAVKLNS